MGTRADFYVGRGTEAKWLGSIAYDGYPDGIDKDVLVATTEEQYVDALMRFFAERDDVSGPDHGWPWPWNDSRLTDYSYAFDGGQVWGSSFGYPWFDATVAEPQDDECDCELDENHSCVHKVVFPDMSDMKNVAWDGRSGLIIMQSPEVPE